MKNFSMSYHSTARLYYSDPVNTFKKLSLSSYPIRINNIYTHTSRIKRRIVWSFVYAKCEPSLNRWRVLILYLPTYLPTYRWMNNKCMLIFHRVVTAQFERITTGQLPRRPSSRHFRNREVSKRGVVTMVSAKSGHRSPLCETMRLNFWLCHAVSPGTWRYRDCKRKLIV